MSSKRAATASASSLSASERVKAEPSHSTDNDVKPDMKPKLEDYIPSVTSISRNWLLHSDPAKLEALLLEECRLSPTFDSRVAASIQESATMLAGEGAIRDFRSEMDLIDAQLLNWSENENWEEIIGSVEFIALGVSETSPLLLKLNALKALSNIIPDLQGRNEWSGCSPEGFGKGLEPEDQWVHIRHVLETMTDDQRRIHIEHDLVGMLDRSVLTKRTRSLYGTKGREIGEEATDDEEEDNEDGDEDDADEE